MTSLLFAGAFCLWLLGSIIFWAFTIDKLAYWDKPRPTIVRQSGEWKVIEK